MSSENEENEEEDNDVKSYISNHKTEFITIKLNDGELVDLGFYNIDNLEANDNFYVTNDSVVWNYLPRELSVFDEVQIALSRKDITMLTENKIR